MSLDDRRRYFAEEIEAVAQLEATALVDAFARVPREHFLGAGPWQVPFLAHNGYRATRDADPRHVYHDTPIAIDPARQLNNGQPSALARWIAALEISPGARVLHIGCGTGYYTAIVAELVGAGGQLVACDVDPQLAERARGNLAAWPQVTVEVSDAGAPHAMFAQPFDAIFVNAGCTYARPEWLAATRRIVMPLTIHQPPFPLGVGAMIRADRAADATRWTARVITQCGIYDCANARDPAHEALLRTVFTSAQHRAFEIETAPHTADPTCVAHIDGFCLQRPAA
jgi:protein-L-isoaspartate(D-aspartate) O-methyltransferase